MRCHVADIQEHAEELEVDLVKYPQVKSLVVECLKAKLPPGWKPVKDGGSDEMYVIVCVCVCVCVCVPILLSTHCMLCALVLVSSTN